MGKMDDGRLLWTSLQRREYQIWHRMACRPRGTVAGDLESPYTEWDGSGIRRLRRDVYTDPGTEWVIETSLGGRFGNVPEETLSKQNVRHRRRRKGEIK